MRRMRRKELCVISNVELTKIAAEQLMLTDDVTCDSSTDKTFKNPKNYFGYFFFSLITPLEPRFIKK